ncbi:MAG TPA: carboxypeptidase-like regulatory domain-containing protein, partial [Gemmatimonadaceae bacterium]
MTNEQGVPLPGATVLIQGTTTGAHTDDAGRYVIVVPASNANGQSGVLVARVIGYSARQVPIVLTAGSNISQSFALV